jgi:excisionase family DNA binding protein
MDAIESSKLLSREAVARTLSLSVRSVERLIGSGQLPTVRLGRRVLVSQSDLERFIAARKGGF